jgi:signal transduction histidine kinase
VAELRAWAIVAVAAATIWLWARVRTRPAALLAVGFGTLALGLVVPYLGGLAEIELLSNLRILLLAFFPWMMAVFACSFERRQLPPWLAGAAGVVVAQGLWLVLGDPVGEDRIEPVFLVIFVALWLWLSAAAAIRLWDAGRGVRLVRARMRTMAAGLLAMSGALLLAAVTYQGRALGLETVITSLVVLASVMFVAGFAPPRPVRWWWRRHITSEFQQMQAGLIAAATPQEVAEAATPKLAEIFGAGVAIIAADGTVLSQAHLTRDQAHQLSARLRGGQRLGPRTFAAEVGDGWLVVRASVYAPIFGRDEDELIEVNATHLRMAFERAELYAAAVRSREELEAMLIGLTHDLRTPAVTIREFARLLEQDPSDLEEFVGHITTSAEHLHRLLDALLSLSRAGRIEGHPEPVDLRVVAQEVADRLASTHPQLQVEIEGEAPPVRMDPTRAEQVLDNLLTNAARHAGRGDVVVQVTLEESPSGQVDLHVVDNGVGIAHEDRERVFALFHRGANVSTAGSGIGLGLVRRIVETAGGHITLAPSEVGAHFLVTLPSLAEHPAPADTDAAQRI